MTHRLMKGVAIAALLVAGSFAHAQTPSGSGAGSVSGTPSAAPGAAGGSAGGMGGASSERAPAGGAMNREGGSAGGNLAREPGNDQRGGPMNRNADDRNTPSNANRDAQAPNDKADNPRAANEGNNKTGTTTGSAPASGQMSADQRTKVTTVIKQQKVQPVTNINFSISVGTRVPREVRFNPLPAEIVTIYPAWRGYEFFLARDEIIVVNPRTLEIVAVLPA